MPKLWLSVCANAFIVCFRVNSNFTMFDNSKANSSPAVAAFLNMLIKWILRTSSTPTDLKEFAFLRFALLFFFFSFFPVVTRANMMCEQFLLIFSSDKWKSMHLRWSTFEWCVINYKQINTKTKWNQIEQNVLFVGVLLSLQFHIFYVYLLLMR